LTFENQLPWKPAAGGEKSPIRRSLCRRLICNRLPCRHERAEGRKNTETGPLLDGKGRRVRFHGRACPFPPVLLGGGCPRRDRCLRRGRCLWRSRSPQRKPRRFRRAPGRITCSRFSCGRVFCSRHSSGRSCPSGGHSGGAVSSGWHCQPVGEEAPRGEAGPGEGEPEGSARPHPGRGSLPRRLWRRLRRRPERQFRPVRPA
jgi:hypothetical protein